MTIPQQYTTDRPRLGGASHGFRATTSRPTDRAFFRLVLAFFPGGLVMLVLKCRPGERIIIGEKIWVIALTGCRIGFDAPREIPIDREKVWEDIQRSSRRRVLG